MLLIECSPIGENLLDPDSPSSIIILVCLLAVYALFAAAKESIVFMRASRRVQLVEEGHAAAEKVDILARDPTHLVATEQLILKLIGSSILALSIFFYTPFLTQTFSFNDLTAVGIVTLIAAGILFIFGELIPRTLARLYAEPIALRFVYLLFPLSYVTAPLARVINRLGQMVNGQADSDKDYYGLGVITEEDLRAYMDASEEGGALKEDEKEMIYSIFNLDDTTAREIMVPRIDMVAVESNTPVMEALDLILEAGHSRLPVFVENIDNIVGILYAKDILAHWRAGGESRPVYGLEREVYYIPENKPVSDLLRELQAKKVQIAIVVDEYGGMAGLVTIEDILEEIVGEIQDEYDLEEFFMEQISEDEFIFSARMDLDDINEDLSVKLPTEDSDTLGGLIYTILGRVPQVGDTVDVESLHLTVLTVDGHRIKTVKVQRLEPPDDEQSGEPRTVENDNPPNFVNSTQNPLPGSS